MPSLVGSEMCIRDSIKTHNTKSSCGNPSNTYTKTPKFSVASFRRILVSNLTMVLIRPTFGVLHLPTNAVQANTTPSAASMPTVSVQLLRKWFAQLSVRNGGGEHVVLAATAVCMCLQRRGSAPFSTSSLLRTMKKGPNHRYIGRCRALPDITSNGRDIGSPPCQQISSSLYRPFRYSGPRYIGPPTAVLVYT